MKNLEIQGPFFQFDNKDLKEIEESKAIQA